MEDKIKKIQESVEKLKTKDFQILFLVPDTKGKANGSVAQIYYQAQKLKNLGYKSVILHEKNDYTYPTWLGDGYDLLEHQSIEQKNLKVGPHDFLIIPELFSDVLSQTKNFPCKRIVLCNSYDFIFDTLAPGISWSDHGIFDFITTTEKQKEVVNSFFPNVSGKIIQPKVSEYIVKEKGFKKPIVAIFSKVARDTDKIAKGFYMKYPYFKWISFKEMLGMTMEDYNKVLNECFCSVWLDEEAGFGMYAIESMKVGTPVVGLVPRMEPEWITEKNGIWTNNFNKLYDLLAQVVRANLEDEIPSELIEAGYETAEKYNEETFSEQVKNVYEEYVNSRIKELEYSIEKFKLEENA